MTDRPILFSGPMVRALLKGRKWKTRRIIKHGLPLVTSTVLQPGRAILRNDHTGLRQDVPLPYAAGDLLWVRETFQLVGGGDPGLPIYRANWSEDAAARGLDNIPAEDPPGWKPSIFMPKWASRITLHVLDVRLEPLQSITRKTLSPKAWNGRSRSSASVAYGIHSTKSAAMAGTRTLSTPC